MINRVVLVGRLTKDPELKYTQSGVVVCRFTLAVNRPVRNDGEQQADFVSCVAWRKTAENTANFLKKGSLAGIDGRIQTGSFEGQDGKRVYTTDVVADSVQFLEPKSNSSGQSNSSYGQAPPQQYGQQSGQDGQQQYTPPAQDPFSNNGPIEVTDDDLPF
jgi:single-strand DNA-binding protein